MPSLEELARQKGIQLVPKSDEPKKSNSLEELAAAKGIELQKMEPKTVQKKPAEEKKKGFLGKAADVLTSGKLLEKPAQFLYGSTGKVGGELITGGMTKLADTFGVKSIAGADVEKLKEQRQDITPKDIGFTALEIVPAGKIVKAAKLIPGVKKLAQVSSGLTKKGADFLKGSAKKQFAEALAPTTKEMKRKAEKVIPELLERKESGSLKKLSSKSQTQLQEKGMKIEEFIENIPEETRVKVKPVLESLEDFKKQFVVDGVVFDKNAVKLAEDLQMRFAKLGDEVPVKSIRRARQVLDKAVARGQGFLVDDITQLSTAVKKEATDAIRKELAKDFPELAQLNKQYSFWRNVDDVTRETLKRKASQTGVVSKARGEIVGGMIGAKLGVAGSAVGAVLGRVLNRAFGSAGWKTKSAVFKNNVANAIAEGNVDKIVSALKTMGVITNNEIRAIQEQKEKAQSEK